MNKEAIARQYIANRQRYIDGELTRCRAMIREFMEMEDTTTCSPALRKLEGEIDAYMNETTALSKFIKALGKEDEEE